MVILWSPDFREDESYEHALLMSSADDAGVHRESVSSLFERI